MRERENMSRFSWSAILAAALTIPTILVAQFGRGELVLALGLSAIAWAVLSTKD